MSAAGQSDDEAGMSETPQPKIQRYLALDAYRGFIMLMLVSQGFGFHELQDHPVFGGIARQFTHVSWEGGVFWDMVQPAFMFIVGAALPFALAIRSQQGQSFPDQAKHAAIRSLKLILLSQVIMSVSAGVAHFQLINVLCQIAFAYFAVFWILQLRWRWQAGIGLGLLVFHTALFFLFPGPDGPFSKEGNIGQVIDQAILGYNYPGHYVTINFIPSTVTTLIGAWTGQLLLAGKSVTFTAKRLVEWAVISFVMLFAFWALVPGVKRIWTATFTFYSAGWVLLMMLAFYYVVEVLQWRKWTFPLIVVGSNSILIYSLSIMLRGWVDDALAVFTGRFALFGDVAPILQAFAIVAVFWSVNYFFYKRRIFLKI